MGSVIWIHKDQQHIAEKSILLTQVACYGQLLSYRYDLRISFKSGLALSDLIFIAQNTNQMNQPCLFGFNNEGQRNVWQLPLPNDRSTQGYYEYFLRHISKQQFENLAKHQILKIISPSPI